jgi:hypothetical protein
VSVADCTNGQHIRGFGILYLLIPKYFLRSVINVDDLLQTQVHWEMCRRNHTLCPGLDFSPSLSRYEAAQVGLAIVRTASCPRQSFYYQFQLLCPNAHHQYLLVRSAAEGTPRRISLFVEILKIDVIKEFSTLDNQVLPKAK